MTEQSDYQKYRGKCKEFCEAEIKKDPTLTLVRGHYMDTFWGPQQHWWLTRPDGTIYDPSAKQFPTKGYGVYVPFDGMIDCEFCGKQIAEEDAYISGHHVYCSSSCYGYDVL